MLAKLKKIFDKKQKYQCGDLFKLKEYPDDSYYGIILNRFLIGDLFLLERLEPIPVFLGLRTSLKIKLDHEKEIKKIFDKIN